MLFLLAVFDIFVSDVPFVKCIFWVLRFRNVSQKFLFNRIMSIVVAIMMFPRGIICFLCQIILYFIELLSVVSGSSKSSRNREDANGRAGFKSFRVGLLFFPFIVSHLIFYCKNTKQKQKHTHMYVYVPTGIYICVCVFVYFSQINFLAVRTQKLMLS